MKNLIEIISWLRIAISPTLVGALIGGIVYLKMGEDGFVPSMIIIAVGAIIGVLWATKIWRKQGTTDFFSGIDAYPELDNKKTDL
jgi:hypothetical protein